MTEITPTKLRDFGLCRYLYKQKHIELIPERDTRPERDKLVSEFDNALLKTVKWFYFESMSDKEPSFKALMWKWEKLWFKNVTAEQIMTASDDPGKNRNSYNTDAHTILSKFYMTHRNIGSILSLNEMYEVPLTEGTKAVGTIDLVTKSKGQTIIEHFGMKSQKAFGRGTENGFKTILDSVAFRHKTGTIENKVRINLLRDAKVIETVVTDTDIKQAKALADEIDVCTNWYPSNGCWWCDKGCQFASECWTGK